MAGAKKRSNPSAQRTRQVAAIPFRRGESGKLEVLLVTSRETRRWVIPKGWPWPDYDDHKAAAEEAREEAGVTGKVQPNSIGKYTYVKQLEQGSVRVDVSVYLLEVEKEKKDWPERKERKREWLSPAKAAARVNERALKAIIRRLAKQA
jgi:8-oxo-dGTP pyrophosphatase MutT (NUDIX family)